MGALDLTGQRFHRLLAFCISGRGPAGVVWKTQCDCGEIAHVPASRLTSGKTKSCGCLRADNMRSVALRHGYTGEPIFQSWLGMHARCYDRNHIRFARYGARGIVVCQRWHEPEMFILDMADTWFPGSQIDRENNDGDYDPWNCKWSTAKEQSRNRSTTVLPPHLVKKAQEIYRFGGYTQAEVGQLLGGISREAIKHVVKGIRR